MTPKSQRDLTCLRWCIYLLVLVLFAHFGCSGCETQQEGPCPETPCNATSRCINGQCISVLDIVCIPSCDDDQVCNLGQCVDVVKRCTAPKQICDPFEPISGDFYCIDWDGLTRGDPGQCSNPCASNASCPEGEACFILSGLSETSCTVQGDCGVGRLCVDNSCKAAACRPAECEGTIKGAKACKDKYAKDPQFANGATCFESDTNQCVPAGLQQIDQPCLSIEDATQNQAYDFTCKLGLTCIKGRCLTPCEQNEMCSGEQECLFAEESVAGKDVGFCGTSCTPFEFGQCAGQNKCLPVDSELGYCVPAGPQKAFEPCAVDTFACEDGTWCVPFGSGQARCMPMCDVGVAPPEGETTVTSADQLKRDATCPQPDDPAFGYARIQHVAFGAGAIDIYLDQQMQPLVSNLMYGQVAFADAMNEPGFVSIAPGAHVLEVRPAGTSSIEAPSLSFSFSIRRDEPRMLVLGDSSAQQSDLALAFDLSIEKSETPGLQILQSIPDLPRVDIVAYPNASNLTGGIELSRGTNYRDFTPAVALAAGSYTIYLWPADNPRQNPQEALLVFQDQLIESGARELLLTGTYFEFDALDVQMLGKTPNAIPEAKLGPPRLTCGDLNNGAFGFCEQVCEDARAYANDVCEGEGMGCQPLLRSGFLGWHSVCRPVGDRAEGEPCNPAINFGECGQGLYCLEYGNTAPGFDATQRGRCTAHCVVDDPEHSTLKCGPNQSCQQLDVAFDIGRCGHDCEPSGKYTDSNCPGGLASCKPQASVSAGSGDGSSSVTQLQPFCSASGNIEKGQPCGGSDCVPGTECLFPRSTQATLVSTLLSPYFGAAGLAPTCVPQCDPFDGQRSDVRCGQKQTCLVNYPWSADVGHCADVVETIQPFQPCSRPGESCGEDSVCVVDGGTPFCLRLCQYVGGPGVDTYSRSTCNIGFQCRPLVNDIGFCQAG